MASSFSLSWAFSSRRMSSLPLTHSGSPLHDSFSDLKMLITNNYAVLLQFCNAHQQGRPPTPSRRGLPKRNQLERENCEALLLNTSGLIYLITVKAFFDWKKSEGKRLRFCVCVCFKWSPRFKIRTQWGPNSLWNRDPIGNNGSQNKNPKQPFLWNLMR